MPPPPSVEVWYLDPRWWGIAISGLIGLGSIALQFYYRQTDKTQKLRDDRFSSDVSDDMKACFTDLQEIVFQVNRVADKVDPYERKKLADSVRDESYREFANKLWLACQIADTTLELSPPDEIFLDLCARWEDEFEPDFVAAWQDEDAAKRRIAASKIRNAASSLKVRLRKKLNTERLKYHPSDV